MGPSEFASLRPIVGVHQPNFFPWLGYFHKMRWSDTFVLLDDALIQNTRGTVTNRTSLASQGKEVVVTAPIDRKGGELRIDRVSFSAEHDFRPRLVALLKQSYAKAAFMKELGETILGLVQNPSASVAEYNGNAIRVLAGLLGLEAKITTSSAFALETTSTARLVDLVEQVGGRTYLAGAGALDYQEDALFFARRINVWMRPYEPPTYPRGKEASLAKLSILDALLHVGPAETRKLLDAPLDDAQLKRA